MNVVMLDGIVACELHNTKTKMGTDLCFFDIATARNYQDDSKNFFTVRCSSRICEYANSVLEKGTRLIIKGRLDTAKAKDLNGTVFDKTIIMADEISVIAHKKKQERTQDMSNYELANISGTNDIPI